MGIFKFLFGKRIVAETDNEWAFLKAAKSGDIEGVRKGLQKKVSVDIRDRVGNSALWLAACYGHFEICDYLLKNGADPKLPDSEGTTPFNMAYHCGKKEVLELFEKHIGEKYKRW